MSLDAWEQSGMLDREVAIYRQLQRLGVSVSFITYGDRRDLAFAERLPGMRILCNRWGLRADRYARWLPWLYGRSLRNADVYKSNQTDGAEVALAAARRWRKPLVARCGYLWSEFAAEQHGVESPAALHAKRIEETVFGAAQRVVVTTPAMAQHVAQRLPMVGDRLRVIPNYVETDRFAPCEDRRPDVDLLYVGRLHPQKNLAALLEAIEPLNVSLRIIGDGPEGVQLRQQFRHLDDRVAWLPRVANADLPAHYRRARIFILPSHYEGHPKALLEAMACGLPVIGADSPGIRELIVHGETGLLCAPAAAAMRETIKGLLASQAQRDRLGRAARIYTEKTVALKTIVQQEKALLDEVVVQTGREMMR